MVMKTGREWLLVLVDEFQAAGPHTVKLRDP